MSQNKRVIRLSNADLYDRLTVSLRPNGVIVFADGPDPEQFTTLALNDCERRTLACALLRDGETASYTATPAKVAA